MTFPSQTLRTIPLLWCLGGLMAGIVVTAIDSQPHWDDTGVLATLVFISASAFSYFRPRYAWLWTLLMSGGIVAHGISSGNPGAIIALIISGVGATAGAVVGSLKGTSHGTHHRPH